jgi:prolyl-tRNA synthetase
MATIKCKGLTGVQFDVTVTYGSTTMNGLTALVQAIEGAPITTGMYGEIVAEKDSAINQTSDGSKTLTAAGLAAGDVVICIPLKTGNKEARQEQKGLIAQAKREGLAAEDTNAVYYRAKSTFNKNRLPNPYEADDYNPDDDENTQQLQASRPWT